MARHWERGLTGAVCVLVVLVAVDSALAQRGRGMRRMLGVSDVQLASLPEVQAELKMTDQQKEQVDEINDKLSEDRRELIGTGFDRWKEIRGRMKKLDRNASEQMGQVLEPAQRKRLQEISIQQNGARALRDADVVATLGLSDEQKTKLEDAEDANRKAFEKAIEDSGREDWRQRAGELGEEADKRLLGVLTEEQQKKFVDMQGEAFNVDLSPLFRGRRGPR